MLNRLAHFHNLIGFRTRWPLRHRVLSFGLLVCFIALLIIVHTGRATSAQTAAQTAAQSADVFWRQSPTRLAVTQAVLSTQLNPLVLRAGTSGKTTLSTQSINSSAAGPVLLLNDNSTRALAIDSATWTSEPFKVTEHIPFGLDPRTRVMMFAQNVDFLPGEDTSSVTADAEDSLFQRYGLTVEYVGTWTLPASVPMQPLKVVILRLNDAMTDNIGDVNVRIYFRGMASNPAPISLGAGTPSPTPTPTPTPSATPTPTPTPSATPTPTPSATPTPTPSATPTPTPSATPTPTPGPSATPTPSPSPTPIPPPTGPVFYSSPTGSPSGNGSINNPWDLQTALNQPSSVGPGATIYLRGGTYYGAFTSDLTGSANSPIVVRSYPGEWAILDNYYETTLTQPLTANAVAGQTRENIAVANGTHIRPGDELVTDGEYLSVVSKVSVNVLDVIRGYGATVPTAHAVGARVQGKNGALEVWGADVIFRDFEVRDSDPDSRVVQGVYVLPTRDGGVNVYGPRTKFINLILHDGHGGFGHWTAAPDSEVYGSIIFNNGFVDSIRGHGHGMYIQNNTGDKYFRDLISFNNFATGMKGFGEGGPANGLHFEGIISFNNGSPGAYAGSPAVANATSGYPSGILQRQPNILIGTGTQPADRNSISNSYFYQAKYTAGGTVRLGYTSGNNGTMTVTSNYFAEGSSGIDINDWQSATFTGNTVFSTESTTGTSPAVVGAKVGTGLPNSAFTINNNQYYYQQESTWDRVFGLALTYSQWRTSTGWDANSTYTPTRPTGTKIFVRPNQYEPGRAHIAVYNWDRQNSVSVDISGIGLQPGQSFQIRDAQNVLGSPIVTGTYTGAPVTIPMTSTAVAAVFAHVFTPAHTDKEFGAFLVLPYLGNIVGSGATGSNAAAKPIKR